MASDSKQTASSSQGKSQSVKIQKQEPVEDEQKDDSFDDFEAADTIEPAEQVKPDNHDPVQQDEKEQPAEDKKLDSD